MKATRISNDTIQDAKRFDRYDIAAAGIIILATLLRLALIALGWPAPYNDEGTVGLMALHIAYHGAHPLLYYGQDYMGSLEAYLGAIFFLLIGPSTFALRLGLLLLFALFLLCMYRLTTLLYAKPLALLTLALLALGSPEVLFRQLMTAGGPPDYFFFCSLLFLLTVWLALEANRTARQGDAATNNQPMRRPPWPRLIAYCAWGLVAGLAIWSHLLCLPFVGCAGLMLLLFCRRELRLSTLILLALCLLIGASPFLIYKATVPVTPYENSLFGGGYREPSYPSPFPKKPAGPQAIISPRPIPPIPGLQVAGTILVSIPVATNGTALCPLSPNEAWPLTDRESPRILFCTGVHSVWGLGFIILWCLATLAALKQLRHLGWRPWKQQEFAHNDHIYGYETIRQTGRLMLLLGAGSTLLVFMLYPQAAAITPWNSARYLVGLLIALPAVLAPLWERRSLLKPSPRWRTPVMGIARYAITLLLFATCLLGTINTFTAQTPLANASERQQDGLIAGLLQKGATHIYTDYDDCNRIAFLSNERIICAALDNGLHPGLDRYFPYRQMVAEAPQPFYVLPKDSAQAYLFEQKAAQQHISYQKFLISGYAVYKPARRIQT